MQRNCVWNPGTCTCENIKYLGSIIDDSVISCHKISANLNEEKVICKIKKFYI